MVIDFRGIAADAGRSRASADPLGRSSAPFQPDVAKKNDFGSEIGELVQFPVAWKRAPDAILAPGIDNGSEIKTLFEAPFYSQEEIKKMPRLKDGRFRKTVDGYYQVRYRRDGYDKQFTSKNLQTVKTEFREWVKSVNGEKQTVTPKKKQLFVEFAESYFTHVKRPNVGAETYDMQYGYMKRHILPRLGECAVREITPMKCQSLLNALLLEGKGRTAELVQTLLKEMLRAAVGEKLLSENPMQYVKIPKHQKQNGRALSSEELKKFITAVQTSYYRKQFMLFLYTGIRRNELHSATFDENFITVANGKCRKGERQTYRKIPIAPGLRQYLPLSQKELAANNKVLSRAFKRICPDHHLYDLRHTFTTRTLESGIQKAVVDLWTGHVNRSDMTTSVYTHFSDEFQLTEIKKLDF